MPKIEGDKVEYQALVLTDSFQTRFLPLTHVEPRCLLPLANVPLIEYTLEFLAQTNVVSEVFLMCSSHADRIQEYIDKSKWTLPSSPFQKIHTILAVESRSVGDAVRDIDARGVITGDFILVSGDVVTNMDLNKALAAHVQHKQNDRDYVCTMVLKQASPLHRARSLIEPACFILDESTNRCLYYQDIPAVNGKRTSIDIDPEVLEDVAEFVVKNDLIDCHVDICTLQVLSTFQENFDYQLLRSDWVKGVLGSDLLKKHIYTYITNQNYAARVESWQTYDGISQDVLERWCYPIVPERNLLEDQTYTYESQHIYKEDNIRLSQSCKIGSCVEIGSGTFIGDWSKINGSIIGRDCYIGHNVVIEQSYIWSGARVEDGVVIKHSIVASDAVIRKNVTINDGSVIGFGVVIDENVIVPEDTKIIKTPIEPIDTLPSDISSDLESVSDDSSSSVVGPDTPVAVADPAVVGTKGLGFLYEDDLESGLVYDMSNLELSDVSIASSTVRHKKKRRTTSTASRQFVSEDEEDDFEQEAIATVDRAMENNHDIDTALLELNTLRMSMNVTYHEVREATCKAMVKRVDHFVETGTLNGKEATEKIFRQWGALYRRQVFDGDDQVDLMNLLQEQCNELDPEYGPMVLLYSLLILYEDEVIEEENIYKWWDTEESKSLGAVREKTAKWVEWLKEAESEEEEEEEESEEEDDSN